ncbi:MAG: thiol:disulfide interchange protein, partial [Candidatus Omnitrophica bacterium]|nr:thiol:disulfide interchange protein [Candidatus Omnitrophota bacterium]
AAKQNLFLGITLLFTYALGMGLPLLILGAFVGLLKKMPKSGRWMMRVKKIFGLLLISAGEYFLIGLR